jgi:hypothetical protein
VLIFLKKVGNWFQNHRGTKQASTKAVGDGRTTTTWTLRKVVRQEMGADLNALILKRDPTALPGSSVYLRHVQECLTELVDGLSKDKAKEFASLAIEWNSGGVDAHTQAK